MKDSTSTLWNEYQAELADILTSRRLARYGLECPGCQARVLLPCDDYLCSNCRHAALAAQLLRSG